MPTFNQLVKKGRQTSVKKSIYRTGSSERLQFSEKEKYRCIRSSEERRMYCC